MKHLIPILLILFLLVGCELDVTEGPEDEVSLGSWHAIGTAFSGSGDGEENPLESQTGSTVKTVLSYQGEIPLSTPAKSYSYQLPMIDLRGAQAQGCNQEIEDRFGSLIRQSIEAMERYEAPLLERLSFTSYTLSGILTLRIDRLDLDGSSRQAFYTVDAASGDAVSVQQLFTAAGISGKPETVINDTVIDLFVKRFGSLSGADESVTTALSRTQAALSPLTANRMHLTQDGKLAVAVELFAPNGGSSVEELLLP